MYTKKGTTLSGIVLSKSTIVASNGRTIPFKNKLKKGDNIWLYYDASDKLVHIEKKTKVIIKNGE